MILTNPACVLSLSLEGCCNVFLSLFFAYRRSIDPTALSTPEAIALDQPYIDLITCCYKNMKIVDPLWMEALAFVGTMLGGDVIDSSTCRLAICLIASMYLVSHDRAVERVQTSAVEHALPSSKPKKKDKRASDSTVDVLHSLDQTREEVSMFDLVSEKVQRRLLATTSRLIKSACDVCVQVLKHLREANALELSKRRSDGNGKKRQRGLWDHQGSDSSAGEGGTGGEDSGYGSSGNEVSSRRLSRSRLHVSEQGEVTDLQPSSDLVVSMRLLLELLSSSEHSLQSVRWPHDGMKCGRKGAGLLMVILSKHQHIAAITSLGVVILSRVDELMVRIHELCKYFQSMLRKKTNHDSVREVSGHNIPSASYQFPHSCICCVG